MTYKPDRVIRHSDKIEFRLDTNKVRAMMRERGASDETIESAFKSLKHGGYNRVLLDVLGDYFDCSLSV